jgi:hypothetical protein
MGNYDLEHCLLIATYGIFYMYLWVTSLHLGARLTDYSYMIITCLL